MRVNAINMLRQAASTVDPEKDTGAYAYMLEELSGHLADVRDGRHSWAEFAEAYCLTERDRKPVPAQQGRTFGSQANGGI